jgi:hypothetical protein
MHGFHRGLHRKIAGATGNSSKGLSWRCGGQRGAHGGGARHGSDGEEEGEKGSARFLTPRCSSGGSLRRQWSDEAAAVTATEARRQWRRWLGL